MRARSFQLSLGVLFAILQSQKSAAAEDLTKLVVPKVSEDSTGDRAIHFPADFAGKWTLLFFYLDDNSNLCGTEATQFNDNLTSLTKRHVQVFGVNSSPLESHLQFARKNGLRFPLLVDRNSILAQSLGTQHADADSRDTFLIDSEGKVRKVWRGVEASGHAAQVYEEILPLVKDR